MLPARSAFLTIHQGGMGAWVPGFPSYDVMSSMPVNDIPRHVLPCQRFPVPSTVATMILQVLLLYVPNLRKNELIMDYFSKIETRSSW
eukprot:scaffold13903_cov22-Prasinocladus_malaysianus.AAC.2